MEKSKVYQAFQNYFEATQYGILIDDIHAKKRFVTFYVAISAIEAYILALNELKSGQKVVYVSPKSHD